MGPCYVVPVTQTPCRNGGDCRGRSGSVPPYGLHDSPVLGEVQRRFPSYVMTRRFTAGIHALPAYLKKNGYRNPTNPTDTALQLGFNTDLHFFEIAKQDPATARQFNNHMSVYSVGRPSWMDVGFFPMQERLIEDSNITKDDALLVDMGGSIGHDLSEFKRKWPDAPGRLILQDLPTVVCHVQGLDPAIQVMPHDFFTPQLVKAHEHTTCTLSSTTGLTTCAARSWQI